MTAHHQAMREKPFPLSVVDKAVSFDIMLAEASVDADRKCILNSIAGVTDLVAEPLVAHDHYIELNNTLRGRFAAAIWRRALEAGRPMGGYQSYLANGSITTLSLGFLGCARLNDEAVACLAAGLPRRLEELALDFSGCLGVGNVGVQALTQAFPKKLRLLDLAYTPPRPRLYTNHR